jgi:predicted NAD/FAD-binding protein
MRVAVIGAGIAGNAAAWTLSASIFARIISPKVADRLSGTDGMTARSGARSKAAARAMSKN